MYVSQITQSLSWNAKFCERLRVPSGVFHRVDVQGEFACINTVDEAAKRAAHPVASVTEFSPTSHV